ncbi:MAG: hypothetical protein ACKVOP_14395 [Sphingomonadaceae bacterium]
MLAWHMMETTGAIQFSAGVIKESMAAWDILEWAEEMKDRDYGPEPEVLEAARNLKPFEDVVIDERRVEGALDFPVEVSLQLDHFDWEAGTAKGSLQHAVMFWEEAFGDDLARQHKKSWLDVDLQGLTFELQVIEMLAPNAPAPSADLLARAVEGPKRQAGPGRRRLHDWDGAFLHLIGEAERNAIAPDPDAHGAQADIAKMIADWFADQGATIPSNSQLQSTAKRVLEHIRDTRARP